MYIYIMAGVPDLTNYLDRIIAGQQDDTIPPVAATATVQRDANQLFDRINDLIQERERASKEREQQIKAANIAAMDAEQTRSELAEDLEMMNKINKALANSNGRLNRTQRIQLNRLIMQTISNTVTNAEIEKELEKHGSMAQKNIRDLFNALIQYYTEMASYGYERAPNILANIGSIVAGTAIIGSTILTPQVGTGGGMLMTLSSFIGPITATASGLYFLQRGGLPVQDMLQSLGAKTVDCIKGVCGQLKGKMGDIYDAGLNSLKTQLNPDYSQFKIDWDAKSGNFSVAPSDAVSVAASTASTASTAAEAGVAIDEILTVGDDEREEEVVKGITAPPNSIDSSLSKYRNFPRYEFMDDEVDEVDYDKVGEKRKYQSDSQISELTNDFGSDFDSDDENGEVTFAKRFRPDEKGGKRARKSRRNTKSIKSRKGRKGRRGRMTKKGRKHRKTLKRYRTKMRR